MANREPMIELIGLGKTFESKNSYVKALEDINLTIYEGEIFGIIGLSGAGKSTLVRCINYLERPTTGKVIFDKTDLSEVGDRELLKIRQSMGMIFQQFNLLMQRNTLQNICFPLEIAGVSVKDAKKRAYELLDVVGLTDKAKAYPAQLSGGQKQRVAIARALATKPKVLLCDEATSALDPTTTRSILELLREINKNLGITIVVITHEMSVIEEICNRVAIIDESRIAEIGDVEEVFMRPKSKIARQLVFSGANHIDSFVGEDKCRIIFDGRTSFEPVIANMVLECRTPVNILFADTKDIDGKAFGQMVIQLPEDESSKKRIFAYLEMHKIPHEEVL
ncbi:MAG: ATP-binding cassette domain-containing protein [Clostridiales bacterium]|jgi:D-methionine transport system ATP-binding protein|nr:ATP-binding cassette domain-containing protein [Clostridiales bacterium]